MPSFRASANVNMRGWQLAQNQPARGQATASPAPPQDPLARSPFMKAPMPLMASTADAFIRQFYSSTGTPQQRILPAKKGAGA